MHYSRNTSNSSKPISPLHSLVLQTIHLIYIQEMEKTEKHLLLNIIKAFDNEKQTEQGRVTGVQDEFSGNSIEG